MVALETKNTQENENQRLSCINTSTLGKIFSSRYFEIFFLFFPENRVWHFMQVVSIGDNLHEMSQPVIWENKKNVISLSSAEFA